jgi:Fes/CIP4/EFC/F-BAR domain-containing protein
VNNLSASNLFSNCLLGLGVLFDKLQQGIQENNQVLAVARTRADAEDLYGQRLADITPATARIAGGFERDDGASVRKVLLSLL